MAKKVMIVDDSATIRQQVSLALGEAGFVVIEAVDGVEGVNKIRAEVDLAAVICDVNMPNKNGLELIEDVRSGGNNSNVPIVMLTTEGQPAMIQRARKAGAKGWIVKPFKPNLLVAALQKLTS